MLKVRKVVSHINGVTLYEFSDGSQAAHQTLKDSRGFLKAGPLDTLNAAQLSAVSDYNAQANKPNGGWL